MVEKGISFWNSLSNIIFAEPARLQLLAVPLAYFIICVIFWLIWFYRRPKMTYGSRSPILGTFKLWLSLIIVLVLLIGAWARPYMNAGNLIVKRGNVEVVFIVDYSASMFLKDTGLARIDIAAREILKLPALEILKDGDRAGLFILGMSGVRLSPLINDLSSFSSEVSKIGLPPTLWGSNVYWGSDIGSTLKRVYDSLDRQDMFAEFKGKEPEGWRPKFKPNRLVIFMGDGDYFNYSKEEARFEAEDKESFQAGLNEFRTRGLKIYPIGIGTRTGGQMLDILKNYKRGDYEQKIEDDLRGQESRLNAYTLEYMRNATGASKLFLMENANADASSFLRTIIDGHRNISIEPGLSLSKEELWLYFAGMAIIVCLFGLMITKF